MSELRTCRRDLLGHGAHVVGGELVDVPLEPGLRPAALVVAARLLLRVVGDLDEPPVTQAIDVAALAVDDRDERAVAAADERHERREVEGVVDRRGVGDLAGQRQRAPEAVQPGGEQREPVRALAAELLAEVAPHAVEVGAEALPLLVRQLVAVRRVRLLRLVERGVEARLRVRGRGRVRGIEVDVERDRTTAAPRGTWPAPGARRT